MLEKITLEYVVSVVVALTLIFGTIPPRAAFAAETASSGWRTLYKTKIQQMPIADLAKYNFSLFDLDGNGIPELVWGLNDNSRYVQEIYSSKDGEIVALSLENPPQTKGYKYRYYISESLKKSKNAGNNAVYVTYERIGSSRIANIEGELKYSDGRLVFTEKTLNKFNSEYTIDNSSANGRFLLTGNVNSKALGVNYRETLPVLKKGAAGVSVNDANIDKFLNGFEVDRTPYPDVTTDENRAAANKTKTSGEGAGNGSNTSKNVNSNTSPNTGSNTNPNTSPNPGIVRIYPKKDLTIDSYLWEDYDHYVLTVDKEKEVRKIEYDLASKKKTFMNTNQITLNREFLRPFEDEAVKRSQSRESQEIKNKNPNMMRKLNVALVISLPARETTVNVRKTSADSKIQKVTFEIGEKELIFENIFTKDDYTVTLTADNFPKSDLSFARGGVALAKVSPVWNAPAAIPPTAVKIITRPAARNSDSKFKVAAPAKPVADIKKLTTKDDKGVNKSGNVNVITNKTETVITLGNSESSAVIEQYEVEVKLADLAQTDANMRSIINEMVAKGIVQGYSDGKFKPDGAISRAEFTSLLLRALRENEGSRISTIRFKDIPKDAWYISDVAKAVNKNYVKGYADGTFRPNDKIKKQEMYKVAGEVIKVDKRYIIHSSEVPSLLSKYYDLRSIPDWVKEDVALLIKIGKYKLETFRNFNGENAMTRWQAAELISRVYHIRN